MGYMINLFTSNKNDFEIKELRDRTNLDKNSVVLDVGSGTDIVNY